LIELVAERSVPRQSRRPAAPNVGQQSDRLISDRAPGTKRQRWRSVLRGVVTSAPKNNPGATSCLVASGCRVRWDAAKVYALTNAVLSGHRRYVSITATKKPPPRSWGHACAWRGMHPHCISPTRQPEFCSGRPTIVGATRRLSQTSTPVCTENPIQRHLPLLRFKFPVP
jgi:hypothetical protein